MFNKNYGMFCAVKFPKVTNLERHLRLALQNSPNNICKKCRNIHVASPVQAQISAENRDENIFLRATDQIVCEERPSALQEGPFKRQTSH